MRLIDANILYAQTAEWEAQAQTQLEKYTPLSNRDEWRWWSAVLKERTAFKFDVSDAPTVDIVVHAKWMKDGHHIRCSACNEYMCIQDRECNDIPQNYCPNCGAKMDKNESEEEK